MAKQKAGEKIVTPKGRLSYPSLFQPDTSDMGKNNYCCTLLFDERDPAVKEGVTELKKSVLKVARAVLGSEAKLKDFKHPFRGGDLKAGKNPEYANMTYISAKSKYRPGIVDAKVREIHDEAEVYAGCYVKVSVVPYWFDQKGNKGVAFRLCNVQKIADGEHLGAHAGDPAGDFEAVDGGDSGEETEFDNVEDDDTDF